MHAVMLHTYAIRLLLRRHRKICPPFVGPGIERCSPGNQYLRPVSCRHHDRIGMRTRDCLERQRQWRLVLSPGAVAATEAESPHHRDCCQSQTTLQNLATRKMTIDHLCKRHVLAIVMTAMIFDFPAHIPFPIRHGLNVVTRVSRRHDEMMSLTADCPDDNRIKPGAGARRLASTRRRWPPSPDRRR